MYIYVSHIYVNFRFMNTLLLRDEIKYVYQETLEMFGAKRYSVNTCSYATRSVGAKFYRGDDYGIFADPRSFDLASAFFMGITC